MTLDSACLHKTYIIRNLACDINAKQHLYTLGFLEGTPVTCVLQAIGGDPLAFNVQGTVIALRKEQCKTITVTPKERDEV